MTSAHEAIYLTIAENCRLAPQQPVLQHLSAAKGARRGASDPESLLAKLLKQFSPEQLREAGVLAPTGDDATTARLHDDLATEKRQFIALCDAFNCPFDLLTARGSLRFRWPAVLSAAKDLYFRKCLRKTETIFIVFSIEDTIAFRSLGLAATLATGLDRLRAPNLDKFVGLMPQDTDVISQNPNRLFATRVVLVGWSINHPGRGVPAGFEAAVGHLQNLKRYLEVPLEAVQIWRPSDDELLRLGFVLRNDRSKDIALRIIDIVEAGSRPLVEAPKPSLSAAYAKLETEARQHNNKTGIGYARQQLAELIHEHFVDRLLHEAEAALDPLEGSLKLTIARLVGELLDCQVDRLLNRFKDRPPAARENDRQDLQDLQTRINLILKLSKQANLCAKLKTNSRFPFDIPRSRF